jgi:hypothetical protein
MMGKNVAIASDPDRALIKAIAMDIGKEVVAYIEHMYPEAIEATSSTFKLSLRNTIHNEIIAALDTTDQGDIIARLNRRKKERRDFKAMWKKVRAMPKVINPQQQDDRR